MRAFSIKAAISLIVAVVLSGCTYNHYYQGNTEMVPTPTSDTAMEKNAVTSKKTKSKVTIYRVH